MTILDTERLVRKLAELLQQTGSQDSAPKLAADYAATCHAANLRLQQCEAMIKAGDRPQAIQLAETAPNLLDMVAVLEFPGADAWRGYCQTNSLPVPDRLDPHSLQALKQCYAQGITTDHPLYATYRSAVLGRNDEVALKTLQSITRLNPADSNAASELARLDAKVLATKLQHLGTSLERADPASLVAEIESIEAFGFKTKPDGETWRQAQAIRCEYLLEEAAKLKSASRWLDVLGKLDLIHRLQEEFKVQLPPPALKQLESIETWARGEQEKDKKERQFQSLLGELQRHIHQSEEKDTSARYVQLPELRDDYEAIHKVWRSLTDFTRPIPEEATASFRKRSALLEAEIVRRTSIRRRIIVASATAVLVIGGVAAWLVTAQMKARDFNRQLQAAVAQRQVHASDRLLEQAQSEKIGDASSLAAAETFTVKEHALQANFETAFKQLPQQLTGDANEARLDDIANKLAQAQDALAALAPDLKTENEPRLQAFQKQWQDYLFESSTAVNQLFDQWVSAAEEKCRGLDYQAPLEKTRTQLAALASVVQKITDTESGFTNHLSLRSDLLQRAATMRASIAACQGELKKYDDGLIAVQKARTLDEFSQGITLIASSEFSAAPAAVAALTVQSLNADAETTLRSLLGATNAATWAYIRKVHPTPFVPEAVMPSEHQIFEQLDHDPAVSAVHHHYNLWLDANRVNSIEWVTAELIGTSPGWNKIKAWTVSPAETSATFDDHDYGYFGGQYKLSPTQPVFRIELLTNADETALFHSTGLEKFAMDASSYSKPLLETLDTIKDSGEGSPLFRAYLFLRLMEVMSLQPDSWGINFCPTARMHEAQIRNIVGPEFGSGDWFVPAKVNACSQKLEQFFTSIKSISYTRQAEGLLALAQSVSKDGLQYAGFVGLDGHSNFINDSVAGEVFGYSAASKKPVVLARKIGQPFAEQAMPLSPLFAFESPLKDYLAKAGINPGDDSYKHTLPPLFQGSTQP